MSSSCRGWFATLRLPGRTIASRSLSRPAGGTTPDAVLRWTCEGQSGEIPVPALGPVEVAELGAIELRPADTGASRRVAVTLTLVAGARRLASNEVEISIYPPRQRPNRPINVPDRALADWFAGLGYAIAPDAELTVARALGAGDIARMQSGARYLVLADGVEQTHRNLRSDPPRREQPALRIVDDVPGMPQAAEGQVPNIGLVARDRTIWRGDWISCFTWIRRAGPLAAIPGGPLLDESFDRVTPHHVMTGFRAHEYGGKVHAGLVVGWVHKPAALIAERQVGLGGLVASTFRLAGEAPGADPVAAELADALVALAGGSDGYITETRYVSQISLTSALIFLVSVPLALRSEGPVRTRCRHSRAGGAAGRTAQLCGIGRSRMGGKMKLKIFTAALLSSTMLVGAARAEVVVEWWDFLGGGDGVRMKTLLDEFNAEHAGEIRIEATTLEWGTPFYTKVQTSAAVGEGPDIMTYHLSRVPLGVEQGAAERDHRRGAGPASACRQKTSPPRTGRRGRVDGKQYAVPFDIHASILYYNKDMLGEAGLLDENGLPKGLDGVEDFTAAMQTLQATRASSSACRSTPRADRTPWRIFYSLLASRTACSSTRTASSWPATTRQGGGRRPDDGRLGRERLHARANVEYPASVALFTGGRRRSTSMASGKSRP